MLNTLRSVDDDPMSDDRRQSIRVNVNEEYVCNLSRGGLFLRCSEQLPIGTEVQLNFTLLLEDLASIRGRGAVVHHGHGSPGLGIRFVELVPESQAIIDRLCPY
jgi:molecular chaperone DnaK